MPALKVATTQFLARVYESARAQGFESQQCVALLRAEKLNWKNSDVIKPIATEFRLGHIAGYLGLTKYEDAIAVAKTPMSERTDTEQRAYRAAVSAWSHVLLLAGVPNTKTGQTRAARTQPAQSAANSNTPKSGNSVPISTLTSPQALAPVVSRIFPRVAAAEEVSNFATWLCDTIAAFETRNTNVKMGEYRTVFHDFIAAVKAVKKAKAA